MAMCRCRCADVSGIGVLIVVCVVVMTAVRLWASQPFKNNNSERLMVDFLAFGLWQHWALLAIVCLILELMSGDFFILCISFGALLTAVAAALGLGFYGQLLVLAVTSVLSIFFIRPRLVKLLHGRRKERPSNADALIGRTGRVSQAIEQGGYGRVAVDGDDWKAVSADGSYIPLGQNVKIVGRESVIVTVERA